MDKKYMLFASFLEDALDYNSCIRYKALDIEYQTPIEVITANDEQEAINIFQKSRIYEQFCEEQRIRHQENVFTYIKREDAPIFHIIR